MTKYRFSGNLVWGLSLLTLVAAFTLVGQFVTPHAPNAMNLTARFQPPSADYWLGTDHFGRDMLSRAMAGALPSISLGILTPALGLLLAVPLALVAGFKRGLAERVILSIVDAVIAVPTLVLSLLVISGLGGGFVNTVLAIGLAMVPKFTRIIHAAVREEVVKDYITAARARGEGFVPILGRELLPNITAPVLVEASIYAGFGITIGASLSYLGLGTQPPDADWGLLIRDAWANIGGSYWPILGPSTLIVVTVVGINLLGDGLRDSLNRGRRVEEETRPAAARQVLATERLAHEGSK